MTNKQIKKFGKFLKKELQLMSQEELMNLILGNQNKDNFILRTDSYKMTHHLLYPEGLTEVYSYLEPRGGEMSYTVFFGLQYYIKEYFAGIRITQENIDEAHAQNIKHFGFDCFNKELWDHVLNDCGGKLPLEIKAVKEGSVVGVKNALLSIRNTTDKSAALTNISETSLLKLWYPCTVAAYSRHILQMIMKFAKISSLTPTEVLKFLIHDFGYRGVSSEETAKIGGAAHIVAGNKGSDTFAAITMLQDFYNADMPAYSVIASEHSIMCAFKRENEELAYLNALQKAPENSILSLVSDTYNIYNVCRVIVPKYKDLVLGRSGKLVIRPDSGDTIKVLFGYRVYAHVSNPIIDFPLVLSEIPKYYDAYSIEGITYDRVTNKILNNDEVLGVFGILFEEFGYTVNEKGFKVLNPKIGVLQGDGISLNSLELIFERMIEEKIDTTCLVAGSGGKLLQAHDRDEQKWAIKATYVKINGEGISIMKDPITDPGKKSKQGYLKLQLNEDKSFKTIQLADEDYDLIKDQLEIVFLNGEILREQNLEEILKLSKITE